MEKVGFFSFFVAQIDGVPSLNFNSSWHLSGREGATKNETNNINSCFWFP